MKRNIPGRLRNIESVLHTLNPCKHCSASTMTFIREEDPTPPPCEKCGRSPQVIRFIVVNEDSEIFRDEVLNTP